MNAGYLSKFLVAPAATLRQAMLALDANASGIVLVVDEATTLLGILTDGDVRRALLGNASLESPVREVMNRHPFIAPPGLTSQDIALLMKQHQIRQLPMVNEAGQLVDLRFREEPALAPTLPVQAVIMAGGFGERLRPLTDTLPKPLLRVGNKPILEIILGRLREWGIYQVWIAVNYKADMIESYFQDGSQWDLNIQYLREPKRLGTIGALRLALEELTQPILVMNGDILTQLDFRRMYRFHCDSGAAMTVGVRHYDFQVPFGVVQMEGQRVTGLAEKPVVEFFVNAGIYLLQPEIIRLIPAETRYDATDLIMAVLAKGQLVNAHPVHEYWLDIGQITDYERANRDVENLEGGKKVTNE